MIRARKPLVCSLLALAALTAPRATISGQATPSLEVGSRTEQVIEKLIGFGVIEDRMSALRPWSLREAGRLLAQAETRLDGLGEAERRHARRLLDLIPSGRLDARVLLEARGGLHKLDSPWLTVPADRGTGGLDAVFNPLARYRGGRQYLEGETLTGELRAEGRLGSHVAFEVEPRFWLGRSVADEDEIGAQLLTAMSSLQFRNLRVDVGRSRSLWGAGRAGGGLLSYDTRGMDRVRLSNDTPFRFPLFLRFLGPSKAELFAARLEADRDIPHSWIIGYALDVRPHPLFELWGSAMIQSMGEGAPESELWERVADHLFINRILKQGARYQSSNKGISIGARVRVPALRHSQIYAEYTSEDPSTNFKRFFWDAAGWVGGVWVPRLDQAGRFDLRVEAHHAGPLQHRHHQFTSGRSVDGRVLGAGGPDTESGFVELGTLSERGRLAFEVGAERRRADRWTRERPGDTWVDVKIEDGPDELYLRGGATAELFGSGSRSLFFRVALERVGNSGFVAGATRYDAAAEVIVRWRFFGG